MSTSISDNKNSPSKQHGRRKELDFGREAKTQLRYNCKIFIDRLNNDIKMNCVHGSYVIVPKGFAINENSSTIKKIITDCLDGRVINYELLKIIRVDDGATREEINLADIEVKIYPKL